MNKKNIFKNYLYNTAYQMLVILAPLVTAPYVSRVLGATGVGIYNYTQSIATYFVLIGSLGITLYGQREIAYVQDDKVKRSEVFWQIALLRIITSLICTVMFFFVFCTTGEYRAVYQILTLEVAATAFDISWFFMGMENFRVTVIRNVIIKLLGIVLVFVLVRSPHDVGIYALCLTLPILLGNISLWLSLPKQLVKIKLNFSKILDHIKPAVLLFIPQLAIEVYVVLDKTMLGALSSNIDEVGFYSQASKIIKMVMALVTSLSTVMLPAMSAAFSAGKFDVIKKGIIKAFRFVFAFGFALVFGMCGIAENFVPLFFGPGYEPVVMLMIIISPIIIIISSSGVLGRQYLLPTKKEKAFTASVVTGCVVNFALNFTFIPEFGAVGASIATVIAEIAVTAVQAYSVRKELSLKECFLPGVKYLLLGVVMGTCVYFTGKVPGLGNWIIVIQILVGVAVYGCGLMITKDEIIKDGLKLIKKNK